MYYGEVQVACLIESLARCIMQSALIVVTNAKFHSNLTLADQSTVEIVGQKEDEQEDIVTRRSCERIVTTFFHFQNFFKQHILLSSAFSNLMHQNFQSQIAKVTSWIKVIRQ